MFEQTFEYHDLLVVAFLIVLEGVLSIDNALVLGLLAKRLPESQRPKALSYGLIGAFGFRVVAIAFAQLLLEIKFVKIIGGGYLLFIALKYFYDVWREARLEAEEAAEDAAALAAAQSSAEAGVLAVGHNELSGLASGDAHHAHHHHHGHGVHEYAKFWPTVLVIELTDIAFAVDSILAAIALVGSDSQNDGGLHPKLWVVVTGGMLGVILMRFAAAVFIKLLERFPRFETAAYLLVTLIGLKLVVDYAFNDAHLPLPHLDFHSVYSPAFWIFWLLMLLCFMTGFLSPKPKAAESSE